jgi:hypothetical protein
MSTTTRNDVKQLAEKIEGLARDVQSKLTNNSSSADLLSSANELVRNNLTLVFTLGEFYALQQVGSGKTVQATTVTNPSGTQRYHNVRDSRGRFTSKV